jgi:thiol-disulfide isomerase/thioredoxin
MVVKPRWILLLVVLLAQGACSRREPLRDRAESPPPTPARGDARADISASGLDADAAYLWFRIEAAVDALGKVPFIVGVHRERPEGVIYSADERLPLKVVTRDPLELRIPVRGIGLRFHSAANDDRVLHGDWVATYYYKRDFEFVATRIPAPSPEHLFAGTAAPAYDVSGIWRFDIDDFGIGRARFRQDGHGTVTGTVIPPEVGDLRHLTGRVIGDRVQMSAFDGMHGFYLDMTSPDGGRTLEGSWLIAGIGKLELRATRDEPPRTHVKVSARMAPGKTRLSLPQLDQAPYRGNPVIVDYFGSWCPVCIDLTPELVRLQREHAAAGLQILSIALEPPGDAAEARRRLDEFREEFGMSWPFHIIFTDDFNGAVAPEILDATGFPVTVFLRRDHTVAAIHTGFVSKAGGPDHDAAIKLIDGYVQQIIGPPSSKRP